MANVGDLVPTTAGKWMTLAPKRCPNGHELGPGTLVGHRACSGPHRGGHTTWRCATCDAVTLGPPPRAGCSV